MTTLHAPRRPVRASVEVARAITQYAELQAAKKELERDLTEVKSVLLSALIAAGGKEVLLDAPTHTVTLATPGDRKTLSPTLLVAAGVTPRQIAKATVLSAVSAYAVVTEKKIRAA